MCKRIIKKKTNIKITKNKKKQFQNKINVNKKC